MEDIDLTMLARSAYRAILRSVETAEAEEPETVKEVVPTDRLSGRRGLHLYPGCDSKDPRRSRPACAAAWLQI